MPRRPLTERRARVGHFLLGYAALGFLLAGLWLGGSLSLLVCLLPLATAVGFGLRPAAEAVVRRRLSLRGTLYALAGDGDEGEQEMLAPREPGQDGG